VTNQEFSGFLSDFRLFNTQLNSTQIYALQHLTLRDVMITNLFGITSLIFSSPLTPSNTTVVEVTGTGLVAMLSGSVSNPEITSCIIPTCSAGSYGMHLFLFLLFGFGFFIVLLSFVFRRRRRLFAV
jgi:hypothetical protein